MNKKIFLVFVIFIVSHLTGCTTTPSINSGSVEVRTDDVHAKVTFHEKDRKLIEDYYRHKNKSKKMPPGLAKKDTLP